MPRKLSLAATFACAAVYLCAVAAPAFAADGAALVLPYGDWIVAAGQIVSTLVVPILGAAVLWAVRTYIPFAGLIVSQALVQRVLQNGIDYATNKVDGAVKGQQLTIPVGSKVIQEAVQRIVDQAPGFLITKMGGPAGIAEKVFRILHLEPGSTAANVLAPVIATLPAK